MYQGGNAGFSCVVTAAPRSEAAMTSAPLEGTLAVAELLKAAELLKPHWGGPAPRTIVRQRAPRRPRRSAARL
jgi:hypothetical protein